MIGRCHLFTLTLVLFVCSGSVHADEAVAPKLTDVAPPAAVEGETPARAMPRSLVICVDRVGKRCWDGERVDDCGAGGGQVFATMAAEGSDPGAVLRACWEQVR